MFINKNIQHLAFAILLSVFCCNENTSKDIQPVKIIAPDLVVQSIEFGKFPDKFSPHDISADKVRFIPVPTRVANECGYTYGYRVKLKTPRSKILVWQAFDTWNAESKKGQGRYEKPSDGYIYDTWLLDGVKNGPHWVKIWIENVALPKLTYTVKY